MFLPLPYSQTKTVTPSAPQATKNKANLKQQIYFLILVFFIVRLAVASVVELGTDEAYYWLYTQYLQWNYFDHPPMVALWGRLFTFNQSLEGQEAFVRLSSILKLRSFNLVPV